LYLALKGKHFFLIFKSVYLYIYNIGEDFNYCAILDDYELGKTLGVGGFGKVILGKHRENKNEVAIKFTNVGDQLSSAHLIQKIHKEADSLKSL
jgi:MAP/microtubule affinity-regulating kinase